METLDRCRSCRRASILSTVKGLCRCTGSEERSLKKLGSVRLVRLKGNADSMVIDNFTVSLDEKLIAVTGCEPKKKGAFKNLIFIFEAKKLKKLCTASLKVRSEDAGAIKKMGIFNSRQGTPLLAAVTEGSYSFYLWEIKETDLRLLCKKDNIHTKYIYDLVYYEGNFFTCSDDCKFNKIALIA